MVLACVMCARWEDQTDPTLPRGSGRRLDLYGYAGGRAPAPLRALPRSTAAGCAKGSRCTSPAWAGPWWRGLLPGVGRRLQRGGHQEAGGPAGGLSLRGAGCGGGARRRRRRRRSGAAPSRAQRRRRTCSARWRSGTGWSTRRAGRPGAGAVARRGSDIGSITVDSEARHGTAARLGVDGQAMYIYVPDQQVGFTPQEKAEWGAYRGSWGSFSQDLGVAGGRENGTGSKRRSFPD